MPSSITPRPPPVHRLPRGSTLAFSAPDGATALTLGGAGKRATVPVGEDGRAVIEASVSTTLPAGLYQSEWMVDGDDGVELRVGPRVRVIKSITIDGEREQPSLPEEEMLAAAQQALLTASGTGAVSISAGGQSTTFQSRNELLSFIQRLENRIADKRRRPLRDIRFRLQ